MRDVDILASCHSQEAKKDNNADRGKHGEGQVPQADVSPTNRAGLALACRPIHRYLEATTSPHVLDALQPSPLPLPLTITLIERKPNFSSCVRPPAPDSLDTSNVWLLRRVLSYTNQQMQGTTMWFTGCRMTVISNFGCACSFPASSCRFSASLVGLRSLPQNDRVARTKKNRKAMKMNPIVQVPSLHAMALQSAAFQAVRLVCLANHTVVLLGDRWWIMTRSGRSKSLKTS